MMTAMKESKTGESRICILYLILLSMRPRQWIKNFFLFPALVFSHQLFDQHTILVALNAFVVFCLLSGAVYLLNDLVDAKNDRNHPGKSARPIASGRLRPSGALTAWALLFAISVCGAFMINLAFGLLACTYAVIQILYSVYLKRIVILDVFSVASGFFLRVVAGAEAIAVPISSWLLICTIFLSLFIAVGKRRHEMVVLGAEASQHRPVLDDYNLKLIDQMIPIVTTGTVLTYSLYTLSSETIDKFGTNKLWLTIPFVLFAVFRYLYCMYLREEGGQPEAIIYKDRPFLVSTLLYVIAVVYIIY
jgi:4-hydroxybenzoate polyprenyltransferase